MRACCHRIKASGVFMRAEVTWGCPVSEPVPAGSKPGIDRLLIASALDADLRRRLLESPDETFRDFDLTEVEKDLLRRPDHRLLPLLGAALAHQTDSRAPEPKASTAVPQPHAVVRARTLPDISLALTLVPCAQYENGRLNTIAYAVWVNPLPQGADPASLPPPQGAVLPGQPLAPLHAVIQVSAVQTEDAAGGPQVALSASLRQSANVAAPPPPEAAGRPGASPFGSDLASDAARAAVAAVRSAPIGQRYGRLIDLMHALRGGEVR
jgi:hypothetical protein